MKKLICILSTIYVILIYQNIFAGIWITQCKVIEGDVNKKGDYVEVCECQTVESGEHSISDVLKKQHPTDKKYKITKKGNLYYLNDNFNKAFKTDTDFSENYCNNIGADDTPKIHTQKADISAERKYVSDKLKNPNLIYDLLSNGEGVAFSIDGKYIASGKSKGVTTLWDISNGKPIRTFNYNATSLEFSPDSRYLALGGYRQTALCDINNGNTIWEYIGNDFTCNDVSFSPDGKYVASAYDGVVIIYDVASGKTVKEFQHKKNTSVNSIDFSPDGQNIVTGGHNRKAIIWNIEKANKVDEFEHKEIVYSVSFSPDGEYLATGTIIWGQSKGKVIIWNVKNGTKLWQFEHQDQVNNVKFSPDGKYFASRAGKKITIWNIIASKKKLIINKQKEIHTISNLKGLAWSSDGKLISEGRQVFRTE